MLDRRIAEAFDEKKVEIKNELRAELDTEIDLLKNELHVTKVDLAETKSELSRIHAAAVPPYDPNVSIVIYGLHSMPEVTVGDMVNWLLSSVLEVEAHIINEEWIEPHNANQVGVIRVELACVEEKINILRAK